MNDFIIKLGQAAAHSYLEKVALSSAFRARALAGAGVDRMQHAMKNAPGVTPEHLSHFESKLPQLRRDVHADTLAWGNALGVSSKNTAGIQQSLMNKVPGNNPTSYGALRQSGYKPTIHSGLTPGVNPPYSAPVKPVRNPSVSPAPQAAAPQAPAPQVAAPAPQTAAPAPQVGAPEYQHTAAPAAAPVADAAQEQLRKRRFLQGVGGVAALGAAGGALGYAALSSNKNERTR